MRLAGGALFLNAALAQRCCGSLLALGGAILDQSIWQFGKLHSGSCCSPYTARHQAGLGQTLAGWGSGPGTDMCLIRTSKGEESWLTETGNLPVINISVTRENACDSISWDPHSKDRTDSPVPGSHLSDYCLLLSGFSLTHKHNQNTSAQRCVSSSTKVLQALRRLDGEQKMVRDRATGNTPQKVWKQTRSRSQQIPVLHSRAIGM